MQTIDFVNRIPSDTSILSDAKIYNFEHLPEKT